MAESIQDTVDRLAGFITQNFSGVETGPGSVINELLLKLCATIQSEQNNTFEALSSAKSIGAALLSTVDTYTDTIDAVASNYNLTRSAGVKAAGRIKVTLSSAYETTYRADLTFVQPVVGLSFVTTKETSVSLTPDLAAGEVQLYSNNGTYFFLLDVEAADAGEAYQLSSGTVLTTGTDVDILGFVKAEAYGSFSPGVAKETDKQLVSKLKTYLSGSRLASAAGITKAFAEKYPTFQSLSVAGSNDPEQLRAKNNLLGVSTFGKVDVYVRNGQGLTTYTVQKQATKLSDGLWELSLNTTDLPGFYYISSIVPTTEDHSLFGTLQVQEVVYDFARYPAARNNDLQSAEEARFTKYQTATVTFSYTELPTVSVDTTATFDVSAMCQPYLTEMQDDLLLSDSRLACGDYLVRGVVPCIVSLELTLVKRKATDTEESLNLAGLKKELFTYINNLPFGSELQASNLIDICHNYGIRRVDLPIKMSGTIIAPKGDSILLEDSDVLTIPTLPQVGVTPNTVAYFVDYYRTTDSTVDSIGINLI